MPRLCEPCRFHSPNDSLAACPKCGGPVKFTLLPPTNDAPPPVDSDDDAPPPPPVDRRVGFGDLFRGKMLVVSVAVVAVVLAMVVGLWAFCGDTFEQRVAKVKVGMPMLEAMRIMGDDNKPAKKKKLNLTVGADGVKETQDRFTDMDAPVDVWGEGFVEYAESTQAVRIEYANGKVTGVYPKQAEGGMRKRYTYN